MRLTTGIDLIEIERVEKAIERHGQRFLRRIFTPAELAECGQRVDSLAARFAAKEAVAKALHTGIGRISWQEIEIEHGPANEPLLRLSGMAACVAGELGLDAWSISLSHTSTHALAMVTATGS
jgi:holo-[acyl-carrier protein] synthase